MKVTITIKGEGDNAPEKKVITVYSLATLSEIERLINQAITKEATDKGWTIYTNGN